jgi:hypothetical protein
MKARWLSTFSLIGIVLIALGIVGLVLGHRFVYDPGQVSDGHEPWYYIIVGALLIVNGLVTQPEEREAGADVPAADREPKPGAARSEASTTRPAAQGSRSSLIGAASKDRPDP